MDPIKFKVHTFGCKVNTYDSGLIQKNLLKNGYANEVSSEPRVHVINSCAVTGEATREALKLIRRLKVKDPFCTVVVTGCGAQVDTGAFDALNAADLVVANSHKGQLPQIIESFFKGDRSQRVFKSNIFKKEDLEMGGGEEMHHTRAFLKIQDGCNSFCTYCIIPYARGLSRSIPRVELAKRVNELYATGVREVVLTGVHIGDYEDLVGTQNYRLEDLIEYLLTKTPMPRFRLSSLEPVEVSDRLLNLYTDKRMCPHFHMSIQSANSSVLKDMKRQYGKEEVQSALMKIRQKLPNAFIGMDVIVGFPTESHEQFEDTYLTLAELPWSKIHVFPYSERQGTKAAAMDVSVPPIERQQRAVRLRELSLSRFEEEAQKQIGMHKQVLVLKTKSNGANGVTEDYWNVDLGLQPEELEKFKGQVVTAQILGYTHNLRSSMEGHLTGALMMTSESLTQTAVEVLQ